MKDFTLKSWAIVAFICCAIGFTMIATTSWLCDRGESLPPWI